VSGAHATPVDERPQKSCRAAAFASSTPRGCRRRDRRVAEQRFINHSIALLLGVRISPE
jgi:hypothetical protein